MKENIFCVSRNFWSSHEIHQGLMKIFFFLDRQPRRNYRLSLQTTAHVNDRNIAILVNLISILFLAQVPHQLKTNNIKTNNIFISRLKCHAQAHPLNLMKRKSEEKRLFNNFVKCFFSCSSSSLAAASCKRNKLLVNCQLAAWDDDLKSKREIFSSKHQNWDCERITIPCYVSWLSDFP